LRLRVYELGIRFEDIGFKVEGLNSKFSVRLGFLVQGVGIRVEGAGFRV
jgi:hypothetical protein